LMRPGVHFVQVGRLRRRLEIVAPELPVAGSGGNAAEPSRQQSRAAALPPGSWTVIGARPDEVAYAASERWGRGALASCRFEPVWAVSFGAGRGAVVRSLAQPLPAPAERSRRYPTRLLRVTRAWADTVYGANIRRPRLLSGATTPTDSQTHAVWAAYVSAAREIKRALKSERR
jgi:hypothetical protein